MSLFLAFESVSVDRTSNEEKQKGTWYSQTSKAELEAFINTSFPYLQQSARGIVQGYRYYQKGTTWHCDVDFKTAFNPDGSTYTPPPRMPQKHRLSSLSVPLPLKTAPNYLVNWDNYLWGRVKVSGDVDNVTVPAVPPEWEIAKSSADFTSVNGIRYRWTETKSAINRDVDKYGNVWLLVAEPKKPGVQRRDTHTYQIFESGEYKNEEDAVWAIDSVLDCIRPAPLLGDMGVSRVRSGDWKCDKADIGHNGKVWLAELVWTLSGDANGWDIELYNLARK